MTEDVNDMGEISEADEVIVNEDELSEEEETGLAAGYVKRGPPCRQIESLLICWRGGFLCIQQFECFFQI